MKTDKAKSILILLLLVIIVILGGVMVGWRNTISEKEGLLSSMNAELITWKDKDSLNHAKIETIQTENTKAFLALTTQDSTIKELQNVVHDFRKYLKNRGSVTNVTNVTEVHNHAGTIVTTDSANNPVYTSNHNLDGWVVGEVVASYDSTKLNLKVKNEYSIIIGEEKDGFMKKKPFVEVINKNPYSMTKTVRTYEVSQKVKKFHIGPYVGVGVGNTLVPQVNIGVGLTYSLFRF